MKYIPQSNSTKNVMRTEEKVIRKIEVILQVLLMCISPTHVKCTVIMSSHALKCKWKRKMIKGNTEPHENQQKGNEDIMITVKCKKYKNLGIKYVTVESIYK